MLRLKDTPIVNKRRLLVILVSILVSAALLALIIRDVPLPEVLDTLRAADAGYLLLSLIMVSLGLVIRGVRWAVLLDGRLPIVRATHMVNVMFLGNQLPMRIGEVARGVLAARDGVPLATSASSIVAERLIDTLVVVLVIALSVSQLPSALPEVSERATQFGLLALVGFLGMLALARFPQLARQLVSALLDAIPALRRLPLQRIADELLEGLRPLTQAQTALRISFWTAGGWFFSLTSFYFLHLALGIETNFIISVPLGIALTALAIALPVSIAALGPFEGAIVITGQMLGMDQLDAIALGFLFHGVTVLGYAVWGVIGLLALGVSPRSAFVQDDQTKSESVIPE